MHFIGGLLKFIFKTVLWLIIIALILVVVLYLSAGKLIQHFGPTVISHVTQTEASLGEVDISLLSGRVTVNNLAVGNPVGYQNKNAFELGQFDVQFDPKSVLTDRIMVKSVLLNGLNVSSEAKASGETNISKLLDNVNKSLGSDKQPAKAALAPKAQPAQAEVKSQKSVIIKDLRVENSAVNVALSGIPGVAKSALGAKVPLPNIHLKDIGEKKPQTLRETVMQVLNTINKEVVQASAKAAKEAAQNALKSGKGVVDSIINSFKKF